MTFPDKIQSFGPPGFFNTNSFLSSGLPYLTGSAMPSGSFGTKNGQVKVHFPYVTRSITVINRSTTDLRIHFNDIDDGNVIGGHHYLTLSEARDSITFVYRVSEIYISLAQAGVDGEFELMAELTNIPAKETPALTGSGLTD